MRKIRKLWTYSLLLAVGLLWTTGARAEFKDFSAIVNNQTGTLLTSDEQVQGTAVSFGVAVADDGTVSRVAADNASAVATISGKYHSEHGCTGLSVVVPVSGNVKITVGQCSYSKSAITVKNSSGETVATKTPSSPACWKNSTANVDELYYTGEATTLTISGMGYCPYIAVEAVETVITKYAVSFSLGSETAEGTVPTGSEVVAGESVTIPANFSLYKEGYTLTGWTDGTNTYTAGQTVTPESDLALTPVFTANTVSLADRTEAVTLNFNLEPQSGVPAINLQGKTGIWVTQATIGTETIDVKMDIDATSGKLNNVGRSSWCQVNSSTKFTIPSCKGATVSMKAYETFSTTTIDGQTDYTQGTTISYEIANTAETIDIVFGSDCLYLSYVNVVLPVVSSGGVTKEVAIIDTDFQDWTSSNTSSAITTNFSNESITFTYSNASVDPTATNEGKFPTSTDAAYKGYILAAKSEATVTTTAFANITKIRYRHGATGSSRGWGLKMKVGDGEWETINDVTVSSPVWVEKEINQENVQLQWYNLNTKQNAYMFELEVYANVVSTAEQVALTTATNIEGAGSVTVYPSADTYDAGTELKLTAEENFGYDFVNWTDAEGNELSTDAEFKYTISADATVTANFEAVDTYELALTVDGTNDYMVTISPEPTVVDGKYMYEADTYVTLTANSYEGLVTFTNWSDGSTNSQLMLQMTDKQTVTAVYAQEDIIAGWDFYKKGNNGRVADFYSAENETSAFTLTNGTSTTGWLDKSTEAANGYEGMKGAAVNWQTTVGEYYWQTKVNAASFTDIKVQFDMLYNYNSYTVYNVDYSLDGETWVNNGSITLTGAKAVCSYNGTLPAEANNQESLYIRMIPDTESDVLGSSGKDGNAVAMFFITGTEELLDDDTAPELVSSVPEEGAENASANGKVVLTFDEKVALVDGATAVLNDQELEGTVSGKTIIFEYEGLEYSTPYTFTLAGGSVSDLTDNVLNEEIIINFSTMSRPEIAKGFYDAYVTNTDELVAAISAANSRSDKDTRFRIFLYNGTYTLPMSTTETINSDDGNSYASPITYITASNISFAGESRDGVIITNLPDNAGNQSYAGTYGTTSVYDGIGKSDVLQISSSASGLYFQDVTVKSGINDGYGRNIAVQDKGTKNIYKNVKLWGYQDTWVSNNDNGLYYFEGGLLRGRTDFLCGKGDIFFNECDIQVCMNTGGYIAVPSKSIKYGYVFNSCTINCESSDLNGKYTLGRPWGQGTPIALWINTTMEYAPSAIGWSEMSNGWPKRFAEYNSVTASGVTVDLSGRKTTFGDGHENNPILTAAEAAEASDMSNMYGDWDPTYYTEQASAPQNVAFSGNTLTWDDSNYVYCWAIVKDGSVIDFTTEPTYTLTDTGSYAVRAANEMGGLGEACDAVVVEEIVNTVVIDENAESAPELTAGTANVTLLRTVKADVWNTLCLPFALSAEQLKAAFGENARIATVASFADNTISFQSGNSVNAYEPCLLFAETASDVYNFENVTIEEGNATDEDTNGNPIYSMVMDDLSFFGVMAKYNLNEGEYFISNNKLYISDGTDSILATRAAFRIAALAEGAKLTFIIDDQGVATAIDNIEGIDNNAPMYNLSGQRVSRTYKGVVIQNGKKYVK